MPAHHRSDPTTGPETRSRSVGVDRRIVQPSAIRLHRPRRHQVVLRSPHHASGLTARSTPASQSRIRHRTGPLPSAPPLHGIMCTLLHPGPLHRQTAGARQSPPRNDWLGRGPDDSQRYLAHPPCPWLSCRSSHTTAAPWTAQSAPGVPMIRLAHRHAPAAASRGGSEPLC